MNDVAAELAPAREREGTELHALALSASWHQQRPSPSVLGTVAIALGASIAGGGTALVAVRPSNGAEAVFFPDLGAGLLSMGAVLLGTGGLVLAYDAEYARFLSDFRRVPSDARLAWGEAHLAALAGREHRARLAVGALDVALASVFMGCSAALLAIPSTSVPLSAIKDALPIPLGIFAAFEMTLGVALLAEPTGPAEQAWHTWRFGGPRRAAFVPWVTPARTGAAAGVALAF